MLNMKHQFMQRGTRENQSSTEKISRMDLVKSRLTIPCKFTYFRSQQCVNSKLQLNRAMSFYCQFPAPVVNCCQFEALIFVHCYVSGSDWCWITLKAPPQRRCHSWTYGPLPTSLPIVQTRRQVKENRRLYKQSFHTN